MRAALVDRLAHQRLDQRRQAMDGIVQPLRVRDVALDAAHHHVDRHAAAPADLHHVAKPARTGRLADDAGIDRLAAVGQALQHLHRAVDRRPLLVAGDQQADRTVEVAAAPPEETRTGVGEGRDRALHVGGAAAEQVARRQLGGERPDRPGRQVAHRHDVGMAGKAEVLSTFPDAGIKIGHVVGAGLGEIHALAGEAQRQQRALQQFQCTRLARRHALAAHQRACQFDHIRGGSSKGVGHRRTIQVGPAKEKRRAPSGLGRRPVIERKVVLLLV